MMKKIINNHYFNKYLKVKLKMIIVTILKILNSKKYLKVKWNKDLNKKRIMEIIYKTRNLKNTIVMKVKKKLILIKLL